MITAPHRLFKVIPGSSIQDDEGNWQNSEPTETYLCDCFLHDLSVKERIGLAGIGIEATHYVNIDRRNDLSYGIEVKVYEGETLRGSGTIKDIKSTSIVGNYTVIYI